MSLPKDDRQLVLTRGDSSCTRYLDLFHLRHSNASLMTRYTICRDWPTVRHTYASAAMSGRLLPHSWSRKRATRRLQSIWSPNFSPAVVSQLIRSHPAGLLANG